MVRQHVALFLLGILGITNALDFYVVTPSTLRLNTEEVIGIAFDDTGDAAVTIEIKDHPEKRKTIVEQNFLVKSGQPQIFKIKLNIADFTPGFLTASRLQKFVSLNVKIKHLQKEAIIPITSQYGYMFIKSDKPLYNQHETASFRIIPLNEDGLPSKEPFQFQIRNPDGIVVSEKSYSGRRRLPKYYATHTYSFPQYPQFGEWTAVARYGSNMEQNSTLTFELQEYVLPTFTVEIKAPDVIFPTDEEIPISVEAKHSYGKEITGVFTMLFGIKKEHSSLVTYFYALKRPKPIIDGVGKVDLKTNEMATSRDIKWFPEIEGSTFVVEATVVDDATGNKVVEINSKGIFSKIPFVISLKRCLSDFKPGLTSVFEADITYMNGKPAAQIPTRLTAVADNSQKLNILQSSSLSDEYGKVSFEIHPERHHKVVTLTLETTDGRYGVNQAKGVCVQRAFASRNNAYIAISRRSQSVLQPNGQFKRDIYLEPKGIKNIYYVVVARGRIQKFDKLYEGDYILNKFGFQVTHNMVPSFRVIVFAHYGNDLIADSLKIDVEKVCGPEAEVKLETKFSDLDPGAAGTITLRGTSGTAVAVYGVDKTVYALSRNDILNKEKLFDTLGSHDLGCGPGGGLDINSVVGNAGVMLVTNKYASSYTDTCPAIKRKKRSTVRDIVNRYEGKEKACCSLGLQIDRHDRICEERYYTALGELDAIHENCSRVFLECCTESEDKNVTGAVVMVPGRQLGNKYDGVTFLEPANIDEYESKAASQTRKTFKETWFISDYIIGANNMTEINISLPHSITTWIIQAISVSPTHGICVANPKTAVTFKKVFLHINLPYSIKQYEQVNIQATVFNYGTKPLVAYVYMHETTGICTSTGIGTKSEQQKLYIDVKSSKTASFPIVPLSTETFLITFVAASSEGSDVVERKLHVVPRGIRVKDDATIKLDPTNRQGRKDQQVDEKLYTDSIDSAQNLQVTTLKLSLPIGTVPGTAKCTITATGDAVGEAVETSLNNPDDLIQLPIRCGEQSMMRLAPTIYTLRYLNYTNKLTPEREEKAFKYIRAGYSNELKFKKGDGAYSVWAKTPPSTWLTAFVMKVFCQGTKFIPLDEKVISSGIQWLLKNQEFDGSYAEKNHLLHKDMMGGVNGVVTMTAFALISLEECRTDDENLSKAAEKARKYLENHMNTVVRRLPAAIVAYALALSNSTKKFDANRKLLSMAKQDPYKNYMYWPTTNSAQDIETAGYGLLTQLALNDLEKSTSVVNWLNTKQLKGGEFKSTQDTVIALQSLAEYAIRVPNINVNLVTNLTSDNFRKVFIFNNDNALQVQSATIENPDGMIFVQTTGIGVGSLTVRLEYNVVKPEREICKFDINVNIIPVENFEKSIRKAEAILRKEPTRKRRQADEILDTLHQNDDDLVYKINICISYKGNNDTGMGIADVGLLSGFKPLEDDLKELEDNADDLIQKFETSSRSIVFYLARIPKESPYCFSFRIEREFDIGNTQSSVIKVYDYYNPDLVCTKFYNPDKSIGLIRTICKKSCECAEGCPPRTFPDTVTGIDDIGLRRDTIQLLLCDKYDYVWLGKLGYRMQKEEEYILIPFNITKVIKEGAEGKSSVENQTRILHTHEFCETGNILERADYLIMGKDPKNQDDDNVPKEYILDKKSFVHLWTSVRASKDKRLQEDLEVVMGRLSTEESCG